MKRNTKKWTVEYENVLSNIQSLNSELTAQHSFINQQRENLDVVVNQQRIGSVDNIDDALQKAQNAISLSDYHKLNNEYIKQANVVLNMRIALSKIHGDLVKSKNTSLPSNENEKSNDGQNESVPSFEAIKSIHDMMKNNKT